MNLTRVIPRENRCQMIPEGAINVRSPVMRIWHSVDTVMTLRTAARLVTRLTYVSHCLDTKSQIVRRCTIHYKSKGIVQNIQIHRPDSVLYNFFILRHHHRLKLTDRCWTSSCYYSYERISCKIMRDDFSFPIVNFPFLCGNIPASPAYGVFVSQLIRYARACSLYIMISFWE